MAGQKGYAFAVDHNAMIGLNLDVGNLSALFHQHCPFPSRRPPKSPHRVPHAVAAFAAVKPLRIGPSRRAYRPSACFTRRATIQIASGGRPATLPGRFFMPPDRSLTDRNGMSFERAILTLNPL